MNNWYAIRFTTLIVCFAVACVCRAESAISLLSGFDAERIEAVYPPTNDDSAGELAKLAYRLRSANSDALEARVGQWDQAQLGDAVAIDGRIQEIQFLNVPARLVEVLELSRLHVVTVTWDQSSVRVFTTALPPQAKRGDQVSGTGVVIEVSDLDDADLSGPIAIASPRLRWFPQSAENIGWQLLSESGVDISLLAEVGSRNRQPLVAADGNAFYAILAAAASLGNQNDNLPTPGWVEPVALLRDPEKMSGQWLQMDLETVQVTRIAVTEPARQTQLGGNHYYQIDAVGDLGNTIVKIEPAKGEPGPPALFEGRYPISIVARELPDFLRQAIHQQEGGDAVVSQIKLMISADAFFYRLWSYQSDFMNQHGSGEQFGPLLIAARLRSRELASRDPAGVNVIGWIAAAAVISAIFATWFWNRRISARDVKVRERRRSRESERLQLP